MDYTLKTGHVEVYNPHFQILQKMDYTLENIYYTPGSVYYTLESVYYTLESENYTLERLSVDYTVWSVLYAPKVYNAHIVVCIMQVE